MRVIIVQVEKGLREDAVRAFTDRGHAVTPVDSTDEAVRWIQTGIVDLVVADLSAAIAGDSQLVKTIHAHRTPVPLLLMTTAAAPGVEPLRELSADVLLHPFSDDAIDEAIEKAQAHHAMHGDALKVLPFVTERIEFVLPSRVEYLDGVLNYLSEHLIRMGIIEPDSIDVVVALDEAIVNAIKHGNGYDPGKRVKVVAEISQEQATFSIEDEGMGFRIEEVPDPCAPENLLRPNGRGLLLIRNIMDDVSYNARGNSLTMVKRSETLGRRNGRGSGPAGRGPETGERQQLN